MLALIAGKGALPVAVVNAASERPLILGMAQSPPDQVQPDLLFRIEHLGGILRTLKKRGVTQICLCGGQTRPDFAVRHLDWRTALLVPKILRVLRGGEDSALRIVIQLFETHGFCVVGAHEIAPKLLPPHGILTQVHPRKTVLALAELGDRVSDMQGKQDLGQSSVLRDGQVVIKEGVEGTDAMLAAVDLSAAETGVLYKAPKPGQDLRVDMPVIGVQTVRRAAELGISGIIIQSGTVMVMDLPNVIKRLNAEGMFLWVRERAA